MRLDVHRAGAAPGLEVGVRPGSGPRHHQLQAGDQEHNRPGRKGNRNEHLHPNAADDPNTGATGVCR